MVACSLIAAVLAVTGPSAARGSTASGVAARGPVETAVTPGQRVRVTATGLIPAQRCTLRLIPLRGRNGRPGRATKLRCGRSDEAGRVALRFRFPRRPPGRPLYRSGERVAIEVATVAPGGGGAAAVRLIVRIR